MGEAETRSCVDCEASFDLLASGRGRPRLRCLECSPYTAGRVKKKSHILKPCAQCGITFVLAYASAKYCGSVCRVKACNGMASKRAQEKKRQLGCMACGSQLTTRKRTYCSETCRLAVKVKAAPGTTHRRRAKKFGVAYTAVRRQDVFARDRWTCKNCGVATPTVLSGARHDQAPHLDHVVPVSLGGPHVVKNLQCLCRRRNLVKGAGSGREGGFSHQNWSAEIKSDFELTIKPWLA